MTILGLDPGFDRLGYGLIRIKNRTSRHVAHGVIATKITLPHHERLRAVYEELGKLLTRYKPDQVALEQLFVHKNLKTVIKIGEVRGVILVRLAKYHVPIREFTPLQIKQAVTGYGRADKKQIQQMVQVRLELDTLPKPDDAADALATALCAEQTGLYEH